MIYLMVIGRVIQAVNSEQKRQETSGFPEINRAFVVEIFSIEHPRIYSESGC